MVAKNTHIKNNTNTKMLDRRQHDTFIFIHEKYIVKKKEARNDEGRQVCMQVGRRESDAARKYNIKCASVHGNQTQKPDKRGLGRAGQQNDVNKRGCVGMCASVCVGANMRVYISACIYLCSTSYYAWICECGM